jgi:hypothetical protein
MSLILSGDTGVPVTTVTGTLPVANGGTGVTTAIDYGFRNRIINGGMVIDQRNAGAAVASGYGIDRWLCRSNSDGVLTFQQSSTAPDGFNYSMLVTTTTADASLSSTQFVSLVQYIEGFNFADMNFGTAGADTVTLSFWVRSSLTGTFGGSLSNNALNRGYPFTYTISVANTFEYKTVTITGDTSGTWVGATNGIGCRVTFGLGVGSAYSGTAGAWAAGEFMSPTGATSVVGTNGATFYITGVQLEKGSTATSFDYRPYGTELALCQRYYVGANTYYFTQGYDSSYTTINSGGVSWDYQMRIVPAITIVSGGADGHHPVPPTVRTGPTYYGVGLQFSGAGLRTSANGSAYVSFSLSAEL